MLLTEKRDLVIHTLHESRKFIHYESGGHSLKLDKKHKIIEISFDRDYIWDDHNYFF